MPIVAKSSGSGDFELSPVGNQQAVCAFVEDIGTHRGSYMGVENERRQVVICWELAEKMTKGENTGKPFMHSKFYTLSLSDKANLRHDLESWRGVPFTEEQLKGFDLDCLKGINCLLNIVSYKKGDGSEGRKVAAISPLVKGMQKIGIVNTMAPEWISKKRSESIEVAEGAGAHGFGEAPPPPPQDGLPF